MQQIHPVDVKYKHIYLLEIQNKKQKADKSDDIIQPACTDLFDIDCKIFTLYDHIGTKKFVFETG